MAKKIPFEFVLDLLLPVEPYTRPMFGCTAVYSGEKLLFILRKKEDHTSSNGVWISTSAEHHASLKKIFPSLRSIPVLSSGTKETSWQMLPLDSDDFEPSAIKACQLVLQGDERIGKIPKARKKKK